MEIRKILHPQVISRLPVRPHEAHKGDFGRVLIVAGSRTMCGAGFLCAKSALAAGAGLVYWALPASMQPYFAPALPEAITVPLPETPSGEIDGAAFPVLQKFIKEKRVSLAVIGPGMGPSALVYPFLTQTDLPVLADADALNRLAADKTDFSVQKFPHCIFTPHAGEMARLLGCAPASSAQERVNQVRELARLSGAVAVLKGADTLICRGEDIYQNTTGGPALAKAGAGDVLSGIIAGLWAQLGTADRFSPQSAVQAACCGVYIHGFSGDIAACALGAYSVLAQDIIRYLPQTFLALGSVQTENL